jgi:hypothetical protein
MIMKISPMVDHIEKFNKQAHISDIQNYGIVTNSTLLIIPTNLLRRKGTKVKRPFIPLRVAVIT